MNGYYLLFPTRVGPILDAKRPGTIGTGAEKVIRHIYVVAISRPHYLVGSLSCGSVLQRLFLLGYARQC